MSLLVNKNSVLKLIISIIVLLNLIKLSIQEKESDLELVKKVISLRKKANDKKEEYKKYEIPNNLGNITNFTEYDNITNIAIFLNKTGISSLKQSVTNQRSSGIKIEYIAKYLESLSKRFEFSEELKNYFKPMFLNITEKDQSWNNYELMYKKNSTNTTLFVCILAKNNKKESKVDFIINQVELQYHFSNFLILKINTSDIKGKEYSDYKFIKTDVSAGVFDYEMEATLNILAATGYNSLADFLEIKDDITTEKSFLKYLQW